MTDRMIDGLLKGLFTTAEASVRVLAAPGWSAEDHAQGRPIQEMLRTAATGLADAMAAASAALPEVNAETARDAAASETIERRLRHLETDCDELAESVDRLDGARAQRGQRRPRSLDEPLPHAIVDVYRVVAHHLLLQGATPEQIRECILCDGRPPKPVAGAALVRRVILKARRICGQAEVEAVRDVVGTPAVFSVLFGVLAEEHRQRTGRETLDA